MKKTSKRIETKDNAPLMAKIEAYNKGKPEKEHKHPPKIYWSLKGTHAAADIVEDTAGEIIKEALELGGGTSLKVVPLLNAMQARGY